MAGDMLVAHGSATRRGETIFGHNCQQPAGTRLRLLHCPRREFAIGENVQVQYLLLPQVRQTCAFLGGQPPGCWGVVQGVNEHRVAVGLGRWRSRWPAPPPYLTGTDLVRLTLERSHHAYQAVEVLTDLIRRYGQGDSGGTEDNLFLLADAAEAYAVEAAGRGWVVQEIHQVRAAGDLALIRQDWDHIAPGLAAEVIARGWYTADGSKLDFAGSLAAVRREDAALRRWGRLTRRLEEANGQIDRTFVRKLLGQHEEVVAGEARSGTNWCRHGRREGELRTVGSLVAELLPAPPLTCVWWAPGPPCLAVYFPLFLEAELPAAWTQELHGLPAAIWHNYRCWCETLEGEAEHRQAAGPLLASLQARFDQEAAEFLEEARLLLEQEQRDQVLRLANLLMQGHLERFEDALQEELLSVRRAVHSPR